MGTRSCQCPSRRGISSGCYRHDAWTSAEARVTRRAYDRHDCRLGSFSLPSTERSPAVSDNILTVKPFVWHLNENAGLKPSQDGALKRKAVAGSLPVPSTRLSGLKT